MAAETGQTTQPEQQQTRSGNRLEAQRLIARYNKLKSDRDAFFMPSWRSAAEWVCPRKSSILGSEKTAGESGWVDNLFDISAMKASERLAAWLMTNTSPKNTRWFAVTSSARTRKRVGNVAGRVDQWWQHVTEVMQEMLGASNFYEEKHEAVLDRNNFGTCALGGFKGRRSTINFRALEIGSYVIAADDEGYIDTLIREFKLTARQAAQQFGLESLGPLVTQAYNSAAQQDKEFTFYHGVYPNTDREAQYEDSRNKKWKSCYVCKEDNITVQEGGFDDMPYAVSRFLKWTGDTWGWAPAFTALPSIRGVNFNKMQEAALLELAAFPPFAEPDTMAGQLDLRAGGRNVYDSTQPDILPKPIHKVDAGAIQAIQVSINEDRQFIKECFFEDIIAMFSNLEREITAYEAAQLAGEKLDVFGPYYHRLITELDQPCLERCFTIGLQEGLFDDPPQELLTDNGDGTATIDLPEVVYLSRLALAMQAHEVQSVDAFIQRGQLIAQVDPALGAEWFKALDLLRTSRRVARDLGIPVAMQKTQEEIEAAEVAQAQQAAAMQAAEVAPKMAKAMKDVDGMSSDGKNRLASFAQSAS